MEADRVHRAVSADGTEIAGRVRGEGPPLVLVHAPPHDGDLAWDALLPHLTGRFTCHRPSLRGRGESGDPADHSPARFLEDVTAYVDSVGEPVRVVGWSAGGALALGAAAHSRAVTAVAVVEPSVWSLMREDDLAGLGAAMRAQAEATAAGRLREAGRVFHRFVCTDAELAALDEDYLDRQSRLFPLLMRELQQGAVFEGPQPTDPDVLGRIEVPVLVLLAEQSRLSRWFTDSGRYVAQHVPDARVHEIPGIGHFAPLVAPEPVAEALVAFFAGVRQPA